MKNGILKSMWHLGMISPDYIKGGIKTEINKKYRCKVCGSYETEHSDKKNICVSCRKEYLEGK